MDRRDPPARLTVLYDETCSLCLRARDWLLGQPCLVHVELLPAGDERVRERYASLGRWLGQELVVVDDRGRAWIGPPAYVMCLWATARYRSWAYRLGHPKLAWLTARVFLFVSKRRHRLGAWFGKERCAWCHEVRITHDVS